ncbi:zinc finger MYM-type protein 1-like, partial [Aphis craccivora]
DLHHDLIANKCISDTVEELNVKYFKKPDNHNITQYWIFHPQQPETNVPFTASKTYFRRDGGRRMWVSYNHKNSSLYCCICLAYGDGSSTFTVGVMKWTHIYLRIEEHESSLTHKQNVDAHIMMKNCSSVDSLIKYGLSSIRKKEIENNRQIFLRVIEIIKLIGKRGLSYRSTKFEAAYTLNDSNLDHGNFLEMVLLVSKFDPILQGHLDIVIKKSASIHNSGSKQGGGLITFLSKTTINYIIDAISQLIKSAITKETEKALIYSVQLDTTQDITVVDQCSIIIRYVVDTKIHERLIGMVKCTSSKGIDFINLLLNTLIQMGINPKNCVGNSTDGAANMQGVYNGFSKKLNANTLTQTHIWCYAHVLNLVICDVTNKILQGLSLFGLLNGCAVFLKESYSRMDIWRSKCSKKKICTIGETRWWSKDSALTKVFGYFNNPDYCLFVELITSLEEIRENTNIKPEARLKANGFMEGLCKYETILTSQIYLRIFNKTTPLSKYLQGYGVNLVSAHQMVTQTLNDLKKIDRDFLSVKQAADKFLTWANNKLEKVENTSIQIQDSLKPIRPRKKSKQFTYESNDDPINDPLHSYTIN